MLYCGDYVRVLDDRDLATNGRGKIAMVARDQVHDYAITILIPHTDAFGTHLISQSIDHSDLALISPMRLGTTNAGFECGDIVKVTHPMSHIGVTLPIVWGIIHSTEGLPYGQVSICFPFKRETYTQVIPVSQLKKFIPV